MDAVARPLPVRAPAWRPVAILLLLAILAAAGVSLVPGARPRLAEPFGPARNGIIAVATAAGDIVGIDPATGSMTTLVGGPTLDSAPAFSRDGHRLAFVRKHPSGTQAVYVARSDGSAAQEVSPPGPVVDGLAWSPGGDRIAEIRHEGRYGSVTVTDVASGRRSTIEPDVDVRVVMWRPGHDELILAAEKDWTWGFYLVGADGTGLRLLAAPNAINLPSLSADGRTLAYTRWTAEDELGPRLEAIDIDTGARRPLASAGGTVMSGLDPIFSPDEQRILFARHVPGAGGFQLAIVSAAGDGPVVPIGPVKDLDIGAVAAQFSPDGTKVLAWYGDDGSTWLLDAADGVGARAPWQADGHQSWQRLAP